MKELTKMCKARAIERVGGYKAIAIERAGGYQKSNQEKGNSTMLVCLIHF